MQSTSSRIWTRITVSISYNGNHFTRSTSKGKLGVMNRYSTFNRAPGLEPYHQLQFKDILRNTPFWRGLTSSAGGTDSVFQDLPTGRCNFSGVHCLHGYWKCLTMKSSVSFIDNTSDFTSLWNAACGKDMKRRRYGRHKCDKFFLFFYWTDHSMFSTRHRP